MEIFSGMKDVRIGYNTDINLENGDLMLTSGIDYIELEIYKLLITKQGDWKVSPLIGCSPNDFIGEQNTRDTALKIEQYIENGLKETIYPCHLKVRSVPTNYTSLMIFIDILFQTIEIDSIPFEFDFANGFRKLNRIDTKVQEAKSSSSYNINNISNMKRPNKYWSYITNERNK